MGALVKTGVKWVAKGIIGGGIGGAVYGGLKKFFGQEVNTVGKFVKFAGKYGKWFKVIPESIGWELGKRIWKQKVV